jgi:phosphoglycolate phosphatase-like HAD superfamily hydrolase
MFKPYDIYCDMDGVLVNFFDAAFRLLGKTWDDPAYVQKHAREARDEMIKKHMDFAHLPPMPDFEQLWNYVKHFNPDILTAYARWDPEGSTKGKQEWNRKYLHVPAAKFHVVARKNKQFYAMGQHRKPNLLIDDYIENINEWKARGGIGILHKNARDTIHQLKDLGYQV